MGLPAGRYAILVTGNVAPPLAEKYANRDIPACLHTSVKQLLCLTRYGNYGDMFIKLLKDSEDETWDVYFVFEKDSPPDSVLANYEVRLQFCLANIVAGLHAFHLLVHAHTLATV